MTQASLFWVPITEGKKCLCKIVHNVQRVVNFPTWLSNIESTKREFIFSFATIHGAVIVQAYHWSHVIPVDEINRPAFVRRSVVTKDNHVQGIVIMVRQI